MIDNVVARFGFARMPFGRGLPAARLHSHHDFGEAAARMGWAVSEKTIALVTGESARGRRSRSAPLPPRSTCRRTT